MCQETAFAKLTQYDPRLNTPKLVQKKWAGSSLAQDTGSVSDFGERNYVAANPGGSGETVL